MELRFYSQLARASQSESEVRDFIESFALVRLRHIVRELTDEARSFPDDTPAQSSSIAWTDPLGLAKSGIQKEWLAGVRDPGSHYLHYETAIQGDWRCVLWFVERCFLSDKQRKALIPSLRPKKRPKTLSGKVVTPDMVSEDVQRLNRILHWTNATGLTAEVYAKYQRALSIHGASQNISGAVGAGGAAIAIVDALNELDPDAIIDLHGGSMPSHRMTPVEVYERVYTRGASFPTSILLKNGRAVVFASDPDVAIFSALGGTFTSAQQAQDAWSETRKDFMERHNRVHLFAVGEVKTATDPQNLHERLALGARETKSEVRADRFLLMSVLTEEITSGSGTGRAMANRDVPRFSDIFSLHFAWGYHDIRELHPEHWTDFKARLASWTGL